jgi:uncharacterized Zn-binding protein involved in type VI secretion
MSAKPAARKGDPTADGDNNPIDSGSPDVLFDGLPAAREGDTTECGSELCDQLSSTVLINGKAAVMVDSEGSAGNVVMSGSGTVLIGDVSSSSQLQPKGVGKMAPQSTSKAINQLASAAVESSSPKAKLNYKIKLKPEGNRTITPLGIPSFHERTSRPPKNGEAIEFTIENRSKPAKNVVLSVISSGTTIYTELHTDTFLSTGTHTWKWDAYDHEGVLDTGLLTKEPLTIRLTATDEKETFHTSMNLYANKHTDWIDTKTRRPSATNDKSPLTVDIIIRPLFTKTNTIGKNDYIPPTTFSTLERWAKEGIEHYWSRNNTREPGIAENIASALGNYIVNTSVDLSSTPKAPGFKLIENLTVNDMRSFSLWPARKIVYNVGWSYDALKSKKDIPKNFYQHYAEQLFRETAAHEFGHLILNSYSGELTYSSTHKGSSNSKQDVPIDKPPPASGEIDLMRYYTPGTLTQQKLLLRTTAIEEDVKGLIWLSRVTFRA